MVVWRLCSLSKLKPPQIYAVAADLRKIVLCLLYEPTFLRTAKKV
jgi:hypothetical protein